MKAEVIIAEIEKESEMVRPVRYYRETKTIEYRTFNTWHLSIVNDPDLQTTPYKNRKLAYRSFSYPLTTIEEGLLLFNRIHEIKSKDPFPDDFTPDADTSKPIFLSVIVTSEDFDF